MTLTAEHRHALRLIADAVPRGCTESILMANAVTIEVMVELIKLGLATATPEHVKAGGKKIEVSRLRITEEGRNHV
jgi:hypothetical protein